MESRTRNGNQSTTTNPFVFDSLIYNGFDCPADGIGNHLSLFDRLIFNDMDEKRKSLSVIPNVSTGDKYGRIEDDRHLRRPELFQNCLLLDIARETWKPELIREQMAKNEKIKNQYNPVSAVYLMWESDRLWDSYAELIASYDFCIVTSSIAEQCLRSKGVDFVRLRHPYDFQLAGSEGLQKPVGSPVRFGVSAGLWPRKNLGLLAEEFYRVFSDDEEVELSIHTRTDPSHRDHYDEYRAIRAVRNGCYRIQLISQWLTRLEYIEWMNSLDVYCFISSGEGYSITPREALHLGIPVILHDAHVHTEFAHLPGVVRVKYDGLQEAIPTVAVPGYDIGHDYRINRESLRDALRYCRENLVSLRDSLNQNYQEIIDFHSMEEIKKDWIDVLNTKYRQYMHR